jgi:hypothetical protein
MTRLLTCGYETSDVNEAGVGTIAASTTHTVVNTTPTPRAGAYCLKIACSASSFAASYKTFSLPVAKTEVWARWAVYLHPASSTTEWGIVQTQDPSGSVQATVSWDPLSTVLRLYRGSVTTGTLLGTSGTTLAPDSWHVLELRHQLLTTTTGTAEVWLDGNQVIAFSGDVVQTSTVSVQFVVLGTLTTLSAATGTYMGIDDIAINDVAGSINNARPGDGRIVLLSPSGAGTTTQLVRGGTDTGANYSQVNEQPPSIAQYVGSAIVGERDLYTLTDIGIAVSSINVVEEILFAQNSDAGGGSLAPTVKSGATTNEATAFGLTTSPGYITGRWETDPNTTAAWTLAGVNALEAGATVR